MSLLIQFTNKFICWPINQVIPDPINTGVFRCDAAVIPTLVVQNPQMFRDETDTSNTNNYDGFMR